MDWIKALTLLPYLLSLLISSSVAFFAWKRRSIQGAAPYALFALLQASMTLGYILELISPSLEAKIFWDNTQFIGTFLSPLAFLLTNAMNYTPSGGRVVVSTHAQYSAEERCVGFSVSDDGPGISVEERAQLFKRFFRGKAGRDSEISGTGLGLAIAKEIVDQHGGSVKVESSGIAGEGATFRVWLRV